ncbi:HK97-gp10 family putative phage morphogenesis protein [Clostridium baratii]|uniref:HK97-gp10 family putative phage morphogenesis protein n=1 Tax=Clostridium baratii TaxID=1561 RepID=UPI0030CF0B10
MSGIEVEGFEQLLALNDKLALTTADKRKAVRIGIETIAKTIEENSPVGKTKKLSKIKVTVREKNLAIEGIARSGAFYDKMQEYGTSQQKKNVGYFKRSVEKSAVEANMKVAKFIHGRKL